MPKSKTTVATGFDGQVKRQKVELPEGEPAPWDADAKLRVVGTGVPRIDGHLKVSGQARYTFDVAEPGMLWAAVLRSPHPAAKIESIDLEAAKKQPGVKAVIAVAQAGDRMRFAGQDVAAVAAERPEQARDARSPTSRCATSCCPSWSAPCPPSPPRLPGSTRPR